MTLKTIKRNVRRFGHRLGLWTDWEQTQPPPGREVSADWYDNAYAKSQSYHSHYSQSCYYFSWTVIADRLLRAGKPRVLEIGCGPGQMAAMLYDQGITEYVGLDFSPTAIKMATRNVPSFRFVVDDARNSKIYEEFDYDIVVCTEVLEHIEDDLIVVSRFLPDTRCICTVPNFPYDSHVRHFKNAGEVQRRYSIFFHQLEVRTLKGTRSPDEEFFLLDGVRNEHRIHDVHEKPTLASVN